MSLPKDNVLNLEDDSPAVSSQQQQNDNTDDDEEISEPPPPQLGSPSFEGSSSRNIPFFFADATLDLDEAHDIADTPEAQRPHFDTAQIKVNRKRLQVPSLQEATPTVTEEEEIAGAAADELSSTRQQQKSPMRATGMTNNQREKDNFLRITGSLQTDTGAAILPVRKPRWPRDIPWAIAFILLVPVGLLYPLMRTSTSMTRSQLAQHPLSFATLHAITWSIAATVLLSKLLYQSVAGGDGEDARSVAASVMAKSAPLSVVVHAALTVTVWLACSGATRWWAALVPALYTIRDVCAFRHYNRRTAVSGVGYASRIAFFQAATSMALDILSRSLRRASFYRVLCCILLLQLGVLLWWRWALFGAMSSGSWLLLAATFVAGKWATATITRVLTLLASAGVMNWCALQTALLLEMPEQHPATSSASGNIQYDNDEEDAVPSVPGGNNSIPEAYRTVDASVYQSVLDMDDELLDDDYDDLDEEVLMDNSIRNETNNRRRSTYDASRRRDSQISGINTAASGDGSGIFHHSSHHHQRSTVKSILWTGITISFGSIVHCALLGGLAQFVYSQVRKIEAAQMAITAARQNGGFRGMQIGSSGSSSATMIDNAWTRITILARRFVRHHSDLAMAHVAAYYKGYVRAARDVATIIEESGVEPILHEDITTHMCTCIGGSITGIIVLITTYLLLHQRKNYDQVSDLHIVENMLLAFILSYTLIFTVLEPLRAAIKAAYVSFAQNPRCLSQAFPLIYHRLMRLSESNLS